MKQYYLLWFIGVQALLSSVAGAQGLVRLNNREAQIPIRLNNEASLAIGDEVFVEILAGPVGGTLAPITSSASVTNRFALGASGWFDGGVGTVPGVPENGLAQFEIRIWRALASYELAHGFGVISGRSTNWIQRVGGGAPKPGQTGPGAALAVPTKFTYSGVVDRVPPLATFGWPDPANKP